MKSYTGKDGSAPMNWAGILSAAKGAARDNVRNWVSQAIFTSGVLNAPLLTTPRGAFQSPVNFEWNVRTALKDAGASIPVADGFASVVWRAWKDWAADYQINHAPFYPTLLYVPYKYTLSPMLNVPSPVGVGVSNREDGIMNLEFNIKNRLGAAANEQGAQQTIRDFSQWFVSSFREWKVKGIIVGLWGEGPVPSFSIPASPGGPVLGGTISCKPGFPPIQGSPFGS